MMVNDLPFAPVILAVDKAKPGFLLMRPTLITELEDVVPVVDGVISVHTDIRLIGGHLEIGELGKEIKIIPVVVVIQSVNQSIRRGREGVWLEAWWLS